MKQEEQRKIGQKPVGRLQIQPPAFVGRRLSYSHSNSCPPGNPYLLSGCTEHPMAMSIASTLPRHLPGPGTSTKIHLEPQKTTYNQFPSSKRQILALKLDGDPMFWSKVSGLIRSGDSPTEPERVGNQIQPGVPRHCRKCASIHTQHYQRQQLFLDCCSPWG
jgi:hypothetical protein